MKKLGFIGCGNMGSAMLSGAVERGYVSPEKVIIHGKDPEEMETLREKYKVETGASNIAVAENAKIVILAVKPNVYEAVMEEIKDVVKDETILVAISPSYSIDTMKRLAGRENAKVVRAMPNTPAMVGCGMTGICFSPEVEEEERKDVLNFFRSFGEAIEVKEELMKAVGSVSGSSPAFVYMMIEAMAQGAILLGIPAKDALKFAAKSVEGAARMVEETGKHPGELRDAVCSAGGTTIEGVVALEQQGFKGAVLEAMIRTAEKFQRMEGEAK